MKYSLRELRARCKLTQKEVADSIGVNAATYNAWETLSSDDLRRLANLFGVEPADIFLAD